MSWLDLFALILATGVPINAWLYEASILAGWREWLLAYAEGLSEEHQTRVPLRVRIVMLFAELMTCRFCMSHWVPWILLALFFVPSLFLEAPWQTLMKCPIYALAATRGALCLSNVMRLVRTRISDLEDIDNQE